VQPVPAKLRDFATLYTAAWCSHDPARVAACYSPTGSLTINDGPPAIGRGAIAEAARSFMNDFPDMQVIMDAVLLKDGVPEYHWTLTGTNTGPRGKGHKVRISGYEVWQMDPDGLIAASQGHFDRDEYQWQVENGVKQAR
jgi:hypothetical protein